MKKQLNPNIRFSSPDRLWRNRAYFTFIRQKLFTKPQGAVLLACFGLFLSSCVSVSKRPRLNADNLHFQIRWTYSSPDQKKSSVSSLIFIQKKDRLSLDVFQPLVGVIGRLILNREDMILLSPLKKQYYRGAFNSKLFFPEFPPFPSAWLTAFLRVQPPAEWICRKEKGLVSLCKTRHFEVHWKYKGANLDTIRLKDSTGQQVKAQIKKISSPQIREQIFKPSLEGWKREKDLSFFKNLRL